MRGDDCRRRKTCENVGVRTQAGGEEQAVIDPADGLVGDYVVPLEEILASAPGLEPGAGIELTDEEFAAFLRAARS
jgi:hypothetical protein